MKVMLIDEVVRDRGSDELYSVAASATVGEAVDEMAQREIGAVLVMNEDQLVAGIFTERDLLMRVVRPGLDTRVTPLSLVMTRELCFVSPGTTVEAAMALMHLRKLRHLLVIDGPVVHGLVSMRDLMYQVVRHGQEWAEEAARAAQGGAPATMSASTPTQPHTT
jgi:CBS domain-containing protein